jgi:hypothetical protein
MLQSYFDEGWNHGLAGIWMPPSGASHRARMLYKEGWNLARIELMVLVEK